MAVRISRSRSPCRSMERSRVEHTRPARVKSCILRPVTRRPWLWLIGLVAALAIVTAVWVSIDRRPPESDHANHLERALRCHRALAGQVEHPIRAILEESSFYPPLVP